MTKTISVIQIIPSLGVIARRDMPAGDYRAFYPLLNCEAFDIARTIGSDWTTREEHARAPIDVYCDDEGLMHDGPLYGTKLPSGQVLAGNLVICSSDDEGETIGVPDWLNVALVMARVQFGIMNPVEG